MIKPIITAVITLVALVACSQPEEPTLALYLAVQRSDINQIERHIVWDSDINLLDKDGQRPLHVAADQGSYVVVKLLLAHGAEVNAKNSKNNTPLSASLLAGRTQIAELLKKKGASIDADQLLAQVVENQVADRDVLALLLQWGANIDHIATNGETPLGNAISKEDLKMVKLLIKNGAGVNVVNKLNRTPLDIAESTKNRDIIRILLKNGAQKNATAS